MPNLTVTEPPEPEESEMLYFILGVSKDATPEEIRLAYKKAANDHHPDKPGGDALIFKQIKEAYEVLIDPIKRQNYDATGIFEGEDAEKVENARGIIASRVEAIINNPDVDLRYLDLVHNLKVGMNSNVKQCAKGIKHIEKAIKRLNKHKKRAKVGLIRSVFDKNIADHEDALELVIRDKEVFELAAKILDTCGYEFEEQPVPEPPTGHPGNFHVRWPDNQ